LWGIYIGGYFPSHSSKVFGEYVGFIISRASLLANATTTMLYGFRDNNSNIQLPKVAIAFSGLARTALAP